VTETLETNRLAPEVNGEAELLQEARQEHAGIGVPLNLELWQDLPDDVREDLVWLQQYSITNRIPRKKLASYIGYDWSVLYKVLFRIYTGNEGKVLAKIREFREATRKKANLQKSTFVPNRNSVLIHNALDFALNASVIVLILGETGTSKTASKDEWLRANNHGRTTGVDATEVSTVKGLATEICEAIGAGTALSLFNMRAAIHKAFNPYRMLVVDEAHFLLPKFNSAPKALEFVRRIHDRAGCGIGIIASSRLGDSLRKAEYHFEQLLGRIDQVVRLHTVFEEKEVRPIVEQYIARPDARTMEFALRLANDQPVLDEGDRHGLEHQGRLRKLVKVLQFGSFIAKKHKTAMGNEHFLKAIATKKAMAGVKQVNPRKLDEEEGGK
jgi:DNA transposition AAA+ family ATPase